MARQKPKAKGANHTLFTVTYEDGSITSNRRVDNALLDQSMGDDVLDLARTALQDQDNAIAERSNQRRAKIKTITKV